MFSCKRRGLCPSCGAKRAAEVAAFPQDEVVQEVGHAQWVFTVPKVLRVYFLHHRDLLGALSVAAFQTLKELMAAAAVEEKGFRPGVVSMVQTFGDRATFNAHVHALVSRGGFSACGEWIPLPYVDEAAAEKLFRHKVLALVRRRGCSARSGSGCGCRGGKAVSPSTTGSVCPPGIASVSRRSSATGCAPS